MEPQLAQRLCEQLRRRHGHRLVEPQSVVTRAHESTFFVSAGIQLWRDWALSAQPQETGRVGLQWCVRTNRTESVGTSGILTSFTMITHVSRGPVEREFLFEELFESFRTLGLAPERLAFLIPEDRSGEFQDVRSTDALARLGIPGSRLESVSRRHAAPFSDGPFGPNIFILAENGPACGSQCTPTCTCGRWFHFWNCEFLDFQYDSSQHVVPAGTPLIDSAGSSERLAAAVFGLSDTYALPAMRSLYAQVSAICNRPKEALPATAERLIRQIADHVRTVALLLGEGVVPSPKHQGHVLRRLMRRAFVNIVLLGGTPQHLVGLVALAAAAHRHWNSFPPLSDSALHQVRADAVAFEALVAKGEQEYSRLSRQTGSLSPESFFRLKSERGVPLELLLAWSRRDGIDIDGLELADRISIEQSNSRDRFIPRARIG